MNIGVISDVLYSGGAQRIARDLSSGLGANNHQVTLFTEYDGKNLIPPQSCSFRHIPCTKCWFKLRFSLPRKLRYLLSPLLGVNWDYPLAVRRLKNTSADIWNIHNLHGRRIPLSLPFQISQSAPVIWTFHDMWPITGGCAFANDADGFTRDCEDCQCDITARRRHDRDPRIGLAYRRRLWQSSSHRVTIVTPSSWLKGQVRRSSVARQARVQVIPNGIDTTVFIPQEKVGIRQRLGLSTDDQYLLVLANQLRDKRKGAEYAFAIIDELMKSNPRLRVMLVGNSHENFIELFADKSVSYPYTQDSSTLAAYYAAADVFLFTSIAENLPLTILEAMACGTCVVAFNVGGVGEEIIDGQTGILKPKGDISGCVCAIQQLLDDQVKRVEMGRNAHEHVLKNFSLEGMIDEYERLFQELIPK